MLSDAERFSQFGSLRSVEDGVLGVDLNRMVHRICIRPGRDDRHEPRFGGVLGGPGDQHSHVRSYRCEHFGSGEVLARAADIGEEAVAENQLAVR